MRKITAIDLCCGAGGLSLGAEYAGVNVTHAIDRDAKALNSFQQNFPNSTTCRFALGEDPLSTLAGLPGLYPECADLVVAGLPCQPFSTSNLRRPGTNHPLSSVWETCIDFIEWIRPKAAVFENVPGLAQRFPDVLKAIVGRLERIGFSVKLLELCADELGIPQRRKRLFIIAARSAHVQGVGATYTASDKITVGEALSDLPALESGNSLDEREYNCGYDESSGYQKIMRSHHDTHVTACSTSRHTDLTIRRFEHVPQGGNWQDIPSDLFSTYSRPENCHRWLFRRLVETEPAITLGNFRKSMIIHPWADRTLSVREAARLQGIPDWFTFSGNLQSRQQQVANAVPPPMGKEVISKLLEVF